MNLYSTKPDAFGADDIANGEALAAHVGVALAAAQNAEHLETAIINRTVIGRAEGILMERFDITADVAFAVLRRVSQSRNVKLNRVAEELVRTRLTPS
jgi:AmiR/NasT family two-component response regulator